MIFGVLQNAYTTNVNSSQKKHPLPLKSPGMMHPSAGFSPTRQYRGGANIQGIDHFPFVLSAHKKKHIQANNQLTSLLKAGAGAKIIKEGATAPQIAPGQLGQDRIPAIEHMETRPATTTTMAATTAKQRALSGMTQWKVAEAVSTPLVPSILGPRRRWD